MGESGLDSDSNRQVGEATEERDPGAHGAGGSVRVLGPLGQIPQKLLPLSFWKLEV